MVYNTKIEKHKDLCHLFNTGKKRPSEYYKLKRRIKTMDKYIKHREICDKLNETYKQKNTAYGDSFGKTFQELGIISAVTRMQDKFNRIKALATGAENAVKDEQLEDTLMDMANYCILTLIELEAQNENN
jgi:hypothetical protein